ncbi:hypothetical protein NM208_g10131 [Fusarium decemcellulare]|uniref:Uncharacterized protein n=1 Tax=Fusarium decemcellulare TaxID=57161 RepID=A0ACC1RZ32_9HYPO|nr:hypothetical protein NM208_g10131 [Fusarium decemcellulare]
MSSSETLDFVSSIAVGRISKAVISRVESRSFTTVKLNSHSESLRQFDEIFSRAEIRDSVKTIRYDVVLPTVSDKRLQNKFQSRKEAAENSHVFTEAMLALFTRLSDWQSQRGVKLTLTVTSPSDDPILQTKYLKVKSRRNCFKYLDIETSMLPSASCVYHLRILTKAKTSSH